MAWSVEDFGNMHVTYSSLKVVAVAQIPSPLVEPALVRMGYEYTDCCEIKPSNLVLRLVACNSLNFGVYQVTTLSGERNEGCAAHDIQQAIGPVLAKRSAFWQRKRSQIVVSRCANAEENLEVKARDKPQSSSTPFKRSLIGQATA